MKGLSQERSIATAKQLELAKYSLRWENKVVFFILTESSVFFACSIYSACNLASVWCNFVPFIFLVKYLSSRLLKLKHCINSHENRIICSDWNLSFLVVLDSRVWEILERKWTGKPNTSFKWLFEMKSRVFSRLNKKLSEFSIVTAQPNYKPSLGSIDTISKLRYTYF